MSHSYYQPRRSIDEPIVEEEQPPHHTEQISEVPGDPARLVTDALIIVNSIIFVSQWIFPEVTMGGIKVPMQQSFPAWNLVLRQLELFPSNVSSVYLLCRIMI